VPVAADVKVRCTENVVAVAPQKSKLFFIEILKELIIIHTHKGERGDEYSQAYYDHGHSDSQNARNVY
jgi:hypothetical protein